VRASRSLRRVWAAKEYHRVLGVAVGGALVLVVVGLLATNRLDDIEGSLDGAIEDARPARQALEDTEEALRASQYEFAGFLLEGEAIERTLKVEDIRRTLSEGESAWRDYLEASLDLPGERALQDEYAELRARQEELTGPVGYMLVRPETVPVTEILASPEFAELRAVQESQREVVATLIDDYYDPLIASELAATSESVAQGQQEVRILLVVSAVLGIVVFVAAFRSSMVHEREQDRLAAERARQARRNELEARLQRALTMAPDEPRAIAIVEEAIVLSAADLPVELLMADASESHFTRAFSTDELDRPGCPVSGPHECPAAQGTETKVFTSSQALDACPHLREREGAPRSAACIPVNVGGRSIGVLHAIAEDGVPPSGEPVDHLELIGDRLGNRLTLLRAMAERESQARIDPLTGLLNRRSLDAAVGPLLAGGVPYVVAFGDLDHFKLLNDTHGHEAGDRALRLFARALRESLRPNDLACRYGGEEFVLVLPDVSLTDAADVVERVRRALAKLLESGTTPAFTVSFGLADSRQADDFADVVRLADRALLGAKAAGRDRVLLAGDPAIVPDEPRAVFDEP
jgi:diguanylate cyclase (GGDEF)-like protein